MACNHPFSGLRADKAGLGWGAWLAQGVVLGMPFLLESGLSQGPSVARTGKEHPRAANWLAGHVASRASH